MSDPNGGMREGYRELWPPDPNAPAAPGSSFEAHFWASVKQRDFVVQIWNFGYVCCTLWPNAAEVLCQSKWNFGRYSIFGDDLFLCHPVYQFFKENVRYPVRMCRDTIFSDFRDLTIILSDSRDPMWNSRDPIRVPKTPLEKTCIYIYFFFLIFGEDHLASGRSLKFTTCRGDWGERSCLRIATAILWIEHTTFQLADT